jgi:hypothetical protein
MERFAETGKWMKGAPRKVVRFLLEHPGEIVRPDGVPNVSPAAASKSLSALVKEGHIQRVRKGFYYVPKSTILGKSRPSAGMVAEEVVRGRARTTGVSAAHALGLTTQVTSRPEVVLYAAALPKSAGAALVHLRQRGTPDNLPLMEAALLEVLRDRGRHSELSPEETVNRVLSVIKDVGAMVRNLQRLRTAALQEPPRVRAILGALLHHGGYPESLWRPLRKSLNPLSRFDFGAFKALPNALEWQAK